MGHQDVSVGTTDTLQRNAAKPSQIKKANSQELISNGHPDSNSYKKEDRKIEEPTYTKIKKENKKRSQAAPKVTDESNHQENSTFK